jgi:hypothetical protein
MGEQDLRDIGIHAVGARRKLAVAIHRERLRMQGRDEAASRGDERGEETLAVGGSAAGF